MGAVEYKTIATQSYLVDILKASIETVFSTTFGVQTSLNFYKADPSPIATGDLSGVIGLVQAQQEGNLIISFSRESICSVLETVYGQKFEEINDSVTEAAGEITNMVFGQFKLKMNSRGHSLKMALPTIITSLNHKILQGKNTGGYFCSFRMDNGLEFTVTLVLMEV